MTPERYAGKPFLRLIDCYLLDAIGELDPAQRGTLEAMAPKLRALYGGQGSWQDIVRRQADLPLPEEVRSAWPGRSAGAGARDAAEKFVMNYVETLGL